MRRICPRCQRRFAEDVRRCPTDGIPLRDDPFIGTSVDRWLLTDFVGQGAMGVVYAAEPTAAIKILNARRAAMQPDLVRRFEVEAEAAMRLESRHIARVFASGTTDDGHLYIAMELLRGEPLDAILARSPRLPPAAAATIAHQITLALSEAHEKHIVHRDLKPANIFVEPAPGGGRHVRVLDFGVARINSESVARSRTGSIAGTPAYMSPEQLRGEPDIDGRSDVYSLGVVLYELLSGVNPFRGEGGVMGTLRRHLELEPPPLPADISPILAAAVGRCLAKHREARPPSMAAVRQILALSGLIGTDADAATIPGISREMLVAAGLYAAAPDPELRPLVKPFVRPVASTPTPAPAEAPAESAQSSGSESMAPTLATLDTYGSPAAGRRPWGRWLAVPGLILLGGAVGWLALASGIGGRTSDPSSAASDASVALEADGAAPPTQAALKLLGAALTRGNSALAAEQWDTARWAFDEALAAVPDNVPARTGRDRAIKEAGNKALFEGLAKAVSEDRWRDALVRLEEFPTESVYSPRVQAMRGEIEQGYADGQLERGRLLIQAGDLPGAERVQEGLAKKPFATDEAARLAEEIGRAKQPDAGIPPKRPDPPARPPKRPSESNLSFDELIQRALRTMTRGDTKSAIALLHAAARKNPKSHVPPQRLCAGYKRDQQYKLALRHCKKWLDLEPNASYRPAIERTIEQLQELINR